MPQQKNKFMAHDFDFTKTIATGGDDITEWFSDSDFYLTDVIRERDVATRQSIDFAL